MITEDHTDTSTTSRPQEIVQSGTPGSEKLCASPCSSTSPTPSPSVAKSSTECSATATSSSGDEGDGSGFHRNGVTPDGVLTPPTDLENQTDTVTKPLRCNGRLEFYKEGVLCLELSHCEEGQARKWLKTKGKSDIRQVVRVSKEVSIPCSPSPPNQMLNNPPNGLSLHDNLSDEGSSAGSSTGSPKSRDKSWRKQSVPQKCISKSLQFFMHPSPCIHGLLVSKKRKQTLTELTPRRPYALPQYSQWSRDDSNSSSIDACECGKPIRRNFAADKKSSILKRNPLEEIVVKLRKDIAEKSSSIQKAKTNCKSQSPRNTPHKAQRQNSVPGTTHTSSRKRPSKEILDDVEQKVNKKPPLKNLEKTILSVPGVGAGNAANTNKGRSGDSTDGRTDASPPAYDHKKYARSHAGRSSPYSLLRPKQERSSKSIDGSPAREATTETEDSAQDLEDMLTPEEQQQYAMSRAISYTITSLLSQGTPTSPSSSSVDKRQNATATDQVTPSQYNQPLKLHGAPFGLEEDKKSFLRHLLDTSDPIPTSTHSSVTGSPTPNKHKTFGQSPDKLQKSKNPGKGPKRSKVTPVERNSPGPDSPRPKGARNSRVNVSTGDSKPPGILSSPLIYGGGTITPPNSSTVTPPHHPPSPYSAYAIPPSPAQLESITAAAMQYACHLIPQSRGSKVAFNNPALPRIQPLIPPNSYAPANASDDDEAPINLSQKDGNWPDANDRASRIQEGRAFPIVPHENLNEGSDPDLPLNLCKKRRDD